jgi:hypothetical protein
MVAHVLVSVAQGTGIQAMAPLHCSFELHDQSALRFARLVKMHECS